MLVLLLLFQHSFDNVKKKKKLTLQKVVIGKAHKELSVCGAWFTNLQAEEKRLIYGYSIKMENMYQFN